MVMLEGDRYKSLKPATVGGERTDEEVGARRIPRPRPVLDWERRAKILDQEVEALNQRIVDLQEELYRQDSRIKALEQRIIDMEKEREGFK